MNATPRQPSRPLHWSDAILNLQDLFADAEHPAYLVGGAVRDALLGRPIKDVDVATSGSGTKLARYIANSMNGAYYPLDDERDVGRALVDTPEGRLIFDVARFRGDDLLADLTDRDFTINAMAVDLRGDLQLLIDPTGGERDAIDRVIRRCSPNAIHGDPVRALRAVRQSKQLNARIDKDTLRDVREVAPRLAGISNERVRDEFFRILSLPDAAGALRVADALGLLPIIIPELTALHGLHQPPPHAFDAWNHTLATVEHLTGILATISPKRTDETAAQFSLGMVVMALDLFRRQLQEHIGQVGPDERSHRALLLLAALLHGTGKAVSSTEQSGAGYEDASARIADVRAAALRLSNSERQRLIGTIRYHRRVLAMSKVTPLEIHRFWRAAGESGVDACLLALADYLATVGPYFEQDLWLLQLEKVQLILSAYYNQRDTIVEPPVLLDGNALQEALNLKRGRIIGELLDLIREAQVTEQVTTADEALELARTYVAEKGS